MAFVKEQLEALEGKIDQLTLLGDPDTLSAVTDEVGLLVYVHQRILLRSGAVATISAADKALLQLTVPRLVRQLCLRIAHHCHYADTESMYSSVWGVSTSQRIIAPFLKLGREALFGEAASLSSNSDAEEKHGDIIDRWAQLPVEPTHSWRCARLACTEGNGEAGVRQMYFLQLYALLLACEEAVRELPVWEDQDMAHVQNRFIWAHLVLACLDAGTLVPELVPKPWKAMTDSCPILFEYLDGARNRSLLEELQTKVADPAAAHFDTLPVPFQYRESGLSTSLLFPDVVARFHHVFTSPDAPASVSVMGTALGAVFALH